MREFNWRWTVRGVRKHLCIRVWFNANPLRTLWRWLTGRAVYGRWNPPLTIYCNGANGNSGCYCPVGRTETFRIELFECGMWGWLSRNPVKRPCVCDKVSWMVLPEEYADEIEEYGLERLLAEFPEVAAGREFPKAVTT